MAAKRSDPGPAIFLAPTLVLALALAATASAEEPGPAPAAPHPHVITQPDWLAKPTPEDLMRHYPGAAWALGLEGRAVLDCTVEISGALAGCRVTAEAPPELGFGRAALLISRGFRMRPMTVDGAPASGGKVTIPIDFGIPPRPASAPPPVDPEALALARQLVATRPEGAAQYKARLAAHFAAPDVFPDDDATPLQTRIAAAEALQTVVRAHGQEVEELPELAVASSLTRDELRLAVQAMVLHQTPPLSPAKLAGAQTAMAEVAEQLLNRIQGEARAIFCKTHNCGAQVLMASGG